MNSAYYAGELGKLRQEIAKKRRGKLTQGVLLLQNNAPAHISQVALAAVTKCSFEVYPHTSYSLDLAPSGCYLFPEKGKRKVQEVPQSQAAALPRPQEEEETDKSKQAQTEQTYEKH